MSSRKKTAHRRIQPYAWLGAGAVTLGMGAAIVGGPAVALASTGADSSGNASTSAASDSASNETKSEAPRSARTSSRVARNNTNNDSTPVVRGRVLAALQDALPEVPAAAAQKPAAAVAESVAVDNDVPAAVTASAVTHPRLARIGRDLAAVVADAVPAAKVPAASVSSAAALDPTPAYPESYLPGAETIGGATNPGDQIIPGLHVKAALDEIAATQGLIKQATWGSGNFLAGIGSIAPQALLATAQLALMAWGATNPGVQNFLESTAGIPIVKWVARIVTFNELLVPTASQIAMGAAGLLIPTLGWVGADVDAAEATLAAAKEDGKVYAIVPIRMKLGTEPTVKARINGGSKATLLVDTGASGIVTTRDKIGTATLGDPIGSGVSCFSGGSECYHYETYNMTVDLGNGAYTTAPVNIVTNNDEYPNSVAFFKDFFAWGADGIIGVGANTEGPGPSPIPTAAMPGELSDGALIFQNPLIFGLGSVMILGPNPLPTRVSVTGAPDAWVKVKVADGTVKESGAIIDSGGVYGTILRSDVPNSVTPVTIDGYDYLPAGTKINVYAPDGTTLLYTYTAKDPRNGLGTPIIDEGLFNTGNAPFAKGPIYLNYGADNPYGQGSTDFSIW